MSLFRQGKARDEMAGLTEVVEAEMSVAPLAAAVFSSVQFRLDDVEWLGGVEFWVWVVESGAAGRPPVCPWRQKRKGRPLQIKVAGSCTCSAVGSHQTTVAGWLWPFLLLRSCTSPVLLCASPSTRDTA